MQLVKDPLLFHNQEWTCMGSPYSDRVPFAHKRFEEYRKMNAAGAEISWSAVDLEMFKYACALNGNWGNKAWGRCERIFGVANIAGLHWAAYEYDFKKEEVIVYDSLTCALTSEREKIFRMHAALAPSLYHDSCTKPEERVDPFTPYALKMAEVPQQPNTSDCGVYAIKFVHCRAMSVECSGLEADKFPQYRKKLAEDIVRWCNSSSGDVYEEWDNR